MHYLLIYDTVDDYVERRAPFRAEHLRLAQEARARGELVLGGALADPVDGAEGRTLERRHRPVSGRPVIGSILPREVTRVLVPLLMALPCEACDSDSM